MDISKISGSVTKLAGDFSTFKTDFAAYTAANPPADPAEQAKLDALTEAVDEIDTGVQALDTALKPAAGPTS